MTDSPPTLAQAAGFGLPDATWYAAALRFNAQPASDLHPSWYARLPHGEIVRRLRAHPPSAPEVSAHLLRVLGLEGTYCTDFSCRWPRLALLDGGLLERLLRRLGLAAHAETLRRELRGERSRALQNALDASDWHFLTRQVPLLGRPDSAPATGAPPDEGSPLAFARAGLAICAPGLAPWGWPLLGRLALKLPADWAEDPPASPAWPSPAPDDRLPFPPLLSKLIKDCAPTWHPLFA